MTRAKWNHQPPRLGARTGSSLIERFHAGPLFRQLLSTSTSRVETLILLNSVVFLHDGGPGVSFQLPRSKVPARGKEVSRRCDYLGW